MTREGGLSYAEPSPLHSETQDGAVSPEQIQAELERLHPAGFMWALCCAGRNREEAEDVLQASYLKVLDGSARFRGQSSFKTFLFGVIRRTAAEHRRRAALRRFFSAQWRSLKPQAAPVIAADERATFLSALASLSRRQREVLELVFYQDVSIEEAARALAISIGSARTHYARGKKRLVQRLTPEGRT
jgi:RNA polymerase sigma factor (sigma-70 family)